MNQQTIDIIGGALTVYEIFARAIPTTKNWSIIHKVFSLLHLASGFLNVKKKGVPTSQNMNAIIFLIASTVLFSCATVQRTKVDCISSRSIPVVLIDNKGQLATVQIPFCDTVRVEVLPDTTIKQTPLK